MLQNADARDSSVMNVILDESDVQSIIDAYRDIKVWYQYERS